MSTLVLIAIVTTVIAFLLTAGETALQRVGPHQRPEPQLSRRGRRIDRFEVTAPPFGHLQSRRLVGRGSSEERILEAHGALGRPEREVAVFVAVAVQS